MKTKAMKTGNNDNGQMNGLMEMPTTETDTNAPAAISMDDSMMNSTIAQIDPDASELPAGSIEELSLKQLEPELANLDGTSELSLATAPAEI